MEVFNKFTFSLLTLFCSTHLMANDYLPQQEDCCIESSKFLAIDGLSIQAEGLYLWAGENDLQFASLNDYSSNDRSSENYSRYKAPSFTNRLGYRVALEYDNPCNCLGGSITYFHFKTNAYGKTATPTCGIQSSNKDKNENTFVTPLFGNNLGNQNPFDYCNANLKLNINLLDLDFGRTLCYNSCFNFRPFIGARYVDISENYKVRAKGIRPSLEPLQNIVSSQHTRLKNNFTGFGIHGGFEGNWAIKCGFSIYGKAAASINYGSYQRKALLSSSVNDYSESDASFDFKQYIKAKQRGPKTIVELGIGVKWDYCICRDQVIGLKLGWEQMLFLNNNRFDNSFTGNHGVVYAFSRNGDLGLQGIVFGANYSF